jgi:hypothetical protein
MLILAAVMMMGMASGTVQEAGACRAGTPAVAQQGQSLQQGQQGTPPVVSRDTIPTAPAPDAKQVLTVPEGTRIPLTLARAINPKRSRKGDEVRAVTAFPVTVDGQVAMPAGVLMEGVVDKLVKKDRFGHPWVQVHFTRMVFPNGYVLPLEGESSQARTAEPSENEEADAESGARPEHADGPSATEEAFQFPQQPTQPPTLPPLPKPNYGPAIGLGIGGAAAAIAIAIIAAHHRYDEFWYDPGWQFDMVLKSPLRVDAGNWSTDTGD